MCLGADLVVGPICLIIYGSHSGLLAQELVSGQQNSKKLISQVFERKDEPF